VSYKLWTNNEYRDAQSGDTFEVDDPATQEVVGVAPRGGADDVAAAVDAAAEAFPGWKRVPGVEKAALLHEVARRFRDREKELATLLTREGGKPLIENRDEMEWSAACFDYYAEIGRNRRGRVIPSIEETQLSLVLHEPYGVVGCIVPWNYPILLLAWKVAPALAAGNTVVVKPSEMTPLSTLKLAEAFDHLPAGVVNFVSGYGAEAGEPLVVHPDVRMIAFTGSVATGQRISELAGKQMKKLHLELGGKDAFVVCDDADLDVAVKGVAWAALLNTGQVCTSTERVYLPQSLADRFTDDMVDYVRSLVLGPGMEPDTDIGPMIGEPYRAKVEEHVAEAQSKGARVLTGGRRPPQLDRGYFYEPTVLVNVNHGMKIMAEETFGPTIPMMTYRDLDEAIALVNDSPYGLGANIYTNDPRKVKRFFEDVKAGTIWINDPLTDNDAGPFGGMKLSGGGRELGEEGLDEFRETKHVHWDFSMEEKIWWYPYTRYGSAWEDL
jgi:acyl-CoA reductase-like NAD-dependent aldehyde dehydrogenase